jgi:hypothetical protein
MDQDRQTYTIQHEKFKKNAVQLWKITNFDRQTALFNGASKFYGGNLPRDFLWFNN